MATSGEFFAADISRVIVHRDGRIRRKLDDKHIAELADSIRRLGLMHPIIITRGWTLVAGENRLEACRLLGHTLITAQWSDDLDPASHLALELEENIKRKDLYWKDRCDALLRFHNLQAEGDPAWTLASTAEAIGYSTATVSEQLSVARELAAGDAKVLAAPKFSVAKGIVSRKTERRKADELSSIATLFDDESLAAPPAAAAASPILTSDFNEWAPLYLGAPFNFLHFDPPYGVGAGTWDQSSASALGGYDDSFDNYSRLIDTLDTHKSKLLGASAHMLFWFSMTHYQWTLDRLRAAGFWVDPFPLVWHKSDNSGIIPRVNKYSRRIYETAFWCSWGDRPIIQSVSNTFSAPVTRTGDHMSSKNIDMLKHFFRMTVDSNTRMLDPTCGGGASLHAARAMGAESILGLELNPEYAAAARKAFDNGSL